MIDTTELENRPIQGGALLPVVLVNGRVLATLVGPVDDVTGALTVVDSVHHHVHEGEMYHAEYLWTSVLNNASANILLVTGAKYPHLVFAINAGGACYVYLYEQCTTIADGTALPAYNMKRHSGGISASMVYHTPTMNALGPALVTRYLSGGNSPTTRVGGGVRTGTEWLIKPNSKYLIRSTNVSGSAVVMSIAVEYYEEDEA